MFTKIRLQKLAGIINEQAEIIDFSSFKKKKENNSFHETAIISVDSQIALNPKDYRYVVMNNEEQKIALVEEGIEQAAKLGAKFYEIGAGEEVIAINEQITSKIEIGTNDSVDGTYVELSVLQPFNNKNEK